MISKEALLSKEPLFINDFDGSSAESIYNQFQPDNYNYDLREYEVFAVPDNLKLLFADYTYEDYSGDAYVLGYDTEKEQFFEVYGGHCSCHGLEGQWDVEYTSYEELKASLERRLSNLEDDWYRSASASKELKEFMEI